MSTLYPHWLDSGVVRAAKGFTGAIAAEEKGSLFEGWTAQLLKAYQSYRGLFDEMCYWSPLQAHGLEVGFLPRAAVRAATVSLASP